MNAADVSRAAGCSTRCHANAEEYDAFLRARNSAETARKWGQRRQQFVQAYPDLETWFSAPLTERVARLYSERPTPARCAVSSSARPYLTFLAVRGYAWFDWEWLLAMPSLYVWSFLTETPLVTDVGRLVDEAVQLGYTWKSAHDALGWAVVRLFMHTLDADSAHIDATTIDACETAVRAFGERPDVALFFGSAARYLERASHYISFLQLLRVLLYHHGQITVAPRRTNDRGDTPVVRPSLKPQIEAVVQQYLATRRMHSRPGTIDNLDLALGHFVAWIAAAHPEVNSFAEVERTHVLEYATTLNVIPGATTGRPLSTRSKVAYLSGLSVFFRETAAWEWEGVPGRALLGRGELPRLPRCLPRYIPEEELGRLMAAVRTWTMLDFMSGRLSDVAISTGWRLSASDPPDA